MLNRNLYNKDKVKMKSTRDGFGDALFELGEKNKKVVALTANLGESVRMNKFAKSFPERFFDMGVAEQNMAGVSAGMALSGKIPFIGSFAVFSPGRNWEQIRVSIAYTNANVKIIGSHSGLGVGEDGATHQALEDIALMRVLPNMIVLSPCDYNQAKQAVYWAAQHKGPVYIRLQRQKTPVITQGTDKFVKAEVLHEGSDVTLISMGPQVYDCLLASKELERKGVSVEVINCQSIKPLDEKLILKSIKKTGRVVTFEDHQIAGGLGSVISELVTDKYPVSVKRLGVNDVFGESGSIDDLYKKHELTVEGIVKCIIKENR